MIIPTFEETMKAMQDETFWTQPMMPTNYLKQTFGECAEENFFTTYSDLADENPVTPEEVACLLRGE